MSRLLYLLRHAKSDWNAPHADDHDRPLNARGRRAADTIGRALATADQVPAVVRCSSAVRTRTTLERAVAAGGWTCPVHITRALYLTTVEDALDLIRAEDDAHESLMLVGHEPTTSSLLRRLIGGGRHRVVTAALAAVELPIVRWADVGLRPGELRWMLVPRLLEAMGAGQASADADDPA
ncbi:MAG: histidine phosphatase family protein [Acidobacteriota bacterium]